MRPEVRGVATLAWLVGIGVTLGVCGIRAPVCEAQRGGPDVVEARAVRIQDIAIVTHELSPREARRESGHAPGPSTPQELAELVASARPLDIPTRKDANTQGGGASDRTDDLVSFDLRTRTLRTRSSTELNAPADSDGLQQAPGSLGGAADLPTRDLDLEGAPQGGGANFSGLEPVDDPLVYPFAPHVKLFLTFRDAQGVRTTFQCSGTLIDPYHVLTAGHCVYLHDEFRSFAETITAIPAYENGQGPLGFANATNSQTWSRWIESADYDYDMAIIDLDRPIGALSGWHGYGASSTCNFYRRTTFTNPGYPAASPFDGETLYTWDGTFDGCDGLQVYFNRRAFGGQSGSGAVRFSGEDSFTHAVLSNGTSSRTWEVAITSDKFTAIETVYIGDDKPTNPDLIALDVKLGSASTPAGEAIDLSYLVLNYSSQPIDQTFSVEVYLSVNSEISTTDRLIQTHEFTHEFAGVGMTRVDVPGGVIIPAGTAPGSYRIGVILAVDDADGENNDSSGRDAARVVVEEGAGLACNGRPLPETGADDGPLVPDLEVRKASSSLATDEALSYSVDITTESEYVFTLCGEHGDASFDSWLCLYDDVGELVASNDDGCGARSELWLALTPGAYRLAVSAAFGEGGAYTLAHWRVDTAPPPLRLDLGFGGPCGDRRSGLEFEPHEAIVDCRLETSDNTTDVGATGWSLGVACDGGQIHGITTTGTVGASTDDDPPGLRSNGFEFSEITSGPGNEGAVSTVILAFSETISLPPEGSAILAKVSVHATYPETATCQTVRLYFRDGLQGSGSPVVNRVSHQGEQRTPTLHECSFDVCGLESEVEFSFDFAGACGERFEADPGDTITRWVDCRLSTRNNPIDLGAKGWEMALRAEGASIVDLTLDGTTGADASEDPLGLRSGGFAITELTTGDGNEGAISAVVLSFSEDLALPAEGTETVLKVAVEADTPELDQCAEIRLVYSDGLRGQGEPIFNRVSFGEFQVRSVLPSLSSCTFQVCGVESSRAWVSFDCNGDGEIDLSDPVCQLQFLFNGAAEPPCTAALDFNADGDIDLSDAVAALTHLFAGGPPHAAGSGCRPFVGCEELDFCQ